MSDTRPTFFSSRLALAWLVAGEWRAHPARLFTTSLAIAVGVALGFAVHLVNGSALTAFDDAIQGLNGAADLQVQATSSLGFDENLYPQVALGPGIADASPVVRLDARVGSSHITILGLDALRAVNVTPSLIGAEAGRDGQLTTDLFADGRIFLSHSALIAIHSRIGRSVVASANGFEQRLRIAGTLPGVLTGDPIGVMDIASTQWRFGRLGKLDRIDLKVSNRATAERSLARSLPPNVLLTTGQSQATQGASLSRAYRVNLDMLALVALVTGGFLVFSAQSLSVARRLRLFALVRTLGLSRYGIVTAVTIEGLVIGVLGSLLGLATGYGLATVALSFFGGDLGAGYFNGKGVEIVFQPKAASLFFLLGLGAAVLGSIVPAQIAARAAPAAALKNAGDILDPRAPMPWIPAVILLACGLVASLQPPLGGLPILGFVAMALLLAGGVAGVPWLARQLLARWSKAPIRRVPHLLAVSHIHGAPGEAATALCGIVASTALMIAMATMVSSFRGAVDEWLNQILSADLYMRVEGEGGFDPHIQKQLASTPGVAHLSFSRQLPLAITANRAPVILIARAVDWGAPLILLQDGRTPEGITPIWVSEPASRLYRWHVGDRVTLPIAKGWSFAVAGIWRDYARQQGAVVIRDTDYNRITHDSLRTDVAVKIIPGNDSKTVAHALLARLPIELRNSVSIASPRKLRQFAMRLFDQSFSVTYILEAVAIVVGLAGVATTVSAQTLSRIREFGMLRHLGMDRSQIILMLGIEGALLGCIGGLAGVLVGGLLSQILIHVVNPQSFNWTMSTIIPFTTILAAMSALVIASAVTAMLAGRQATAQAAILAVREDW